MSNRLTLALKRRFATPQDALFALGLPVTLLENGDTHMYHTRSLAAVAALKRHSLLALDASTEEAERVIRSAEEGEDRARRARDTRRTPRMGDAEMAEREREEATRDALRRAADAADLDEEDLKDVIEVLAENYPQVLASVQHEMAADNRGPKGWARDRAERRHAADTLRVKDAARARKFGANDDPPPFKGMPNTGGSISRDDPESVGFRRDNSWPENGGGNDRRRAHDLALDGGSTLDAFASWLPGAASINKV